MEIICAFFSTVVIITLIGSIIVIWKQKIQLEINLKLVLFIEAFSVFVRGLYNYFSLALTFKDESDETRFVLWSF